MQNQITVVLVFFSDEILSRHIWAHTLQDLELHRKIFKNISTKLWLELLELKVGITSFLISKPTLDSIPYFLVPSCKYFPEQTIILLRNWHNLNTLSNYVKCLSKLTEIYMGAQKNPQQYLWFQKKKNNSDILRHIFL